MPFLLCLKKKKKKKSDRNFPKVIETDLEAVYLSYVIPKIVIEEEFRAQEGEPILLSNARKDEMGFLPSISGELGLLP